MKSNVTELAQGNRNNLKHGSVINTAPVERTLIDTCLSDILSHAALFSVDECKVIMELAPDEWQAAQVGKRNSDEAETRESLRNNSAHMLEPNEDNYWLFDKILELVTAANNAHFHVDINHFDAVQISKYEVGEYYNTHIDLGPGRLGNRKISLTLQITDPSEYDGGDLVMDFDDFTASREIGSVTLFPSFLTHHVTPVTRGTRYSIVAWISGEHRFK